MKKVIGIILVAVAFVFTSCDELGLGGIPIEQSFTESFTLEIQEGIETTITGSTALDLSELDEFADITESIQSLEIKKIQVDIKEYDAPEDIFMEGLMNASDDEFVETSVEIGLIEKTNLYDLYSAGESITLSIDTATMGQLTDWILVNDQAWVEYEFALLDADGNAYVFEEEDYGKKIVLEVKIDIVAMVSSIPDLGGDLGI